MEEISYESIYNWDKLIELFNGFLPELVHMQSDIIAHKIIVDLPSNVRKDLETIGFSPEGRDPEEVTRQLIDQVYPYRMRTNHPRYFCFIPNDISPYSVFGEFINSIHNPYGSIHISGGTSVLENETIRWMGSLIGYDADKSGGQFLSGGSLANLTAMIVARDEKLNAAEFIKGTLYVSDQTHSSVAKAAHIMGIAKENIRIVPTDNDFKMDIDKLEDMIRQDSESGFIPFLVVGSCGTTNTGSVDPLERLGEIAEKYGLWYHVDGAYGATVLLSNYKHLLKGIEKSDSVSWDGHKWLFQTFGCGAVICKDKMKLVKTFHTHPEYLKDVKSSDQDYNFWDMGPELTRPARGMKLWFTLQTVGTDAMCAAIDKGFMIGNWIEEEVSKYPEFELISHSQMGIVNFRFADSKYTEAELDKMNLNLSKRAIEKNHAAFFTTVLRGKVVLRFCANNPLVTSEEIRDIIGDIHKWILTGIN